MNLEKNTVANMLPSICRSSVLMVCGTGPSTRRSPSAMSLATISWRWTGTAETPAMLWWSPRATGMPPTEGCSPLQITTTTSRVETVPGRAVDGGWGVAAQADSTQTPIQCGSRLPLWPRSRPVACCWKSTSYELARRLGVRQTWVPRSRETIYEVPVLVLRDKSWIQACQLVSRCS